jgi:hypothetical protein
MSWKFLDWRQVRDEVKGRLGLGYEINLPKHPTHKIYIDGAVFRRASPPIDPIREYCGLCKQAPCKDL